MQIPLLSIYYTRLRPFPADTGRRWGTPWTNGQFPRSRKKEKSTISVGVYSFLYLYLINPSLFTEMGESRLKMNLLYTSSSVKGHSVQCRRCLQCIYTRYVTVRMHFRWPRPQSAQ